MQTRKPDIVIIRHLILIQQSLQMNLFEKQAMVLIKKKIIILLYIFSYTRKMYRKTLKIFRLCSQTKNVISTNDISITFILLLFIIIFIVAIFIFKIHNSYTISQQLPTYGPWILFERLNQRLANINLSQLASTLRFLYYIMNFYL